MDNSEDSEIVEIKQEPHSPSDPSEEPELCDDASSSEHDELPPASDFLTVQIKEEPPSSPRGESVPDAPVAPGMLAGPVPMSCLSASMMANHAALEEDNVEAILPDRISKSPSPELTFEMTATIKEEKPDEWEGGDAPADHQGCPTMAGDSSPQPRAALKRKKDFAANADVCIAKRAVSNSAGSHGLGGANSRTTSQMKEYNQTKTCLENRIVTLENEKAAFEAKIKANTKASKLDQLQTDADRGVVKAKFLLDQLRCYGKGTYDWSEETLNVCKQWAKKFPQDYKQCSVDFLNLPTLAEMGIKAGETVREAPTASKKSDTSEDSEESD